MEDAFEFEIGTRKNEDEVAKAAELKKIFLEKFLAQLYSDTGGVDVTQDKLSSFCERLIAKYTREEVEKRLLFHVIVASGGVTEEVSPYFDFEGEDSIEKFIREF